MGERYFFAGSGPNRSIEYVIKQSSLIDLYCACHRTFLDNYYVPSRSKQHANPDIRATI